MEFLRQEELYKRTKKNKAALSGSIFLFFIGWTCSVRACQPMVCSQK